MRVKRGFRGGRSASGAARRASPLLALGLIGLALIASGCEVGGSEPDPTDAEERERSDRPDEREGEPGDGAEGDEVARRIRDACRDVVERAPGISDELTRDLIAECDEAAADDAEAARRAAGAVCDAIAAATVPWPLRETAADACRRALPAATRL